MDQDHLTPELADLMEHEKVIEQGLATFIDVGWALLRIRDGQKYRAAGYPTFEDYCRERWAMGRQYAYRLMDAASIAEDVSPIGDIQPTHETQLRPLKTLSDPDDRAEAWSDAVAEADDQQPTARQVTEAVERRKVSKPDLGGGVSHPARFSDELLPIFAELLIGYRRVLDPFAGTGRIHELALDHETIGIELEPEWVELHPRTFHGDALVLQFETGAFDAICTSPTYGNRLADHHEAQDASVRRSYRHDLGRPLHPNNSGQLHWGPDYRTFHERAWREAIRVLRPGGRFVLNISDHYRGGIWQDVAGWHLRTLCLFGLRPIAVRPVVTRRLRQGDNTANRVPAELIVVLDRPEMS